MKLKWIKDSCLALDINVSVDADPNSFTVIDKKNISCCGHKTIKNCQNFLAKDLTGQCIGMNTKKKVKSKSTTNEFIYFLESSFVEVNRLFVLVYLNQNYDVKRYKARRCYLPNGTINAYNVIVNGKNFYDQPIYSDRKRFMIASKIIID